MATSPAGARDRDDMALVYEGIWQLMLGQRASVISVSGPDVEFRFVSGEVFALGAHGVTRLA